MLIKLNHVTHLSDARYGAGMGVRWMGLQCCPDEAYYVSPERAGELAKWVVGLQFVAELPAWGASAVQAWLRGVGTDYTFHAVEVAQVDIPALLPEKMPFFYRHVLHSATGLQVVRSLSRQPLYYVLSFVPELWPSLREEVLRFAVDHPVLLHTRLSLSDAKGLQGQLAGFAIDSEAESRPGWQDYAFLREMMELFDEDDDD